MKNVSIRFIIIYSVLTIVTASYVRFCTDSLTLSPDANKSIQTTEDISTDDSDSPVLTGISKTTVNAADIRGGAAWTAYVIGSVPAGVSVIYIMSEGNWCEIEYGDTHGWVYNLCFSNNKNYVSLNTDTLDVYIDDWLFKNGTSIQEIFDYVRVINYTSMDNDTIENLCVYAIKNNRGSCYHHAALLYYMLSRAGYESYLVAGEAEFGEHNWVLVKVDGAWRHIDATPRFDLASEELYLKTDTQIYDLGLAFYWDKSKYPPAV